METARWQQIQELFMAVEAMEGYAQIDHLNQLCRDQDVRDEVISLLRADEKVKQFLTPVAITHTTQIKYKSGNMIGPYCIESLLGEGGMGAVYKAKDTRLQRAVALKFPTQNEQQPTVSHERFLIEAQAASRLDHVNICTIYDIGKTESGQPYIAMGYYPGDSLAKHIAQQPPNLTHSLEIVTQILRGAETAHQQGIFHRDLKPENIILTQNNVVKILDFGIAKITGVDITMTGNQIGTIAYMSPEQLQGKNASQQSDIWSCGVILYELLTGERPFKGRANHEIMYSIIQDAHQPLKNLNPGLPDELQRIIDRMLCHDLQLRYPSAQSVLDELFHVSQTLNGFTATNLSARIKPQISTHTQQHKTSATTTFLTSDGDVRQATVMSVDLCNYSTLLQSIEPETSQQIIQQFFKQIKKVILSYGGTINREIDNTVIAIFGVPIAHENDARRAIHAAFACHSTIKNLGINFQQQLTVHIGIANGSVLMNNTADSSNQQFTLSGDSLTLATRLDDLAQTNETIISDSLQQIINQHFICEHTGSVKVRYQQEPIEIWRVLSDKHIEMNCDQPLFGRTSELQQFTNLLHTSQAQRQGQVVYICGEAGIGKTRFANECKQIAGQSGYEAHQGLILNFGVSQGQGAVAAIIRSMLSLSQPADVTQHQMRIELLIKTRISNADHVIHLNDFLGLPLNEAQQRLFDVMDHAARMQSMQDVVKSIIRNNAQQQPLLILFEDLHWADINTLDCIVHIAASIQDVPVILLLTTRPENEPLTPAWRNRMENTPLISFYLAALHKEDSRKMAKSLAGNDNNHLTAIIQRAQGNPLFLEQLIRNTTNINDPSQLPSSLQSLVQSQLDKLAIADRHAARAASIIGQRFTAEQLRFLLNDPYYDCQRLVQHQLAQLRGNDFLFNHALIHEGIYASILVPHKQELHNRAANWFTERDKSLTAEHLDRANSPAAADAYLAAAEEQKQQYHFDVAIRLIQRAIQITTDVNQLYLFYVLLGDVLTDMGEITAAAEAFLHSLQAASNDKQRCRAWIGLAQGYDINDEHDNALAALNKAETAAQAHELMTELAQIHYQRGNLFFPRGDIQTCRNEHQTALQVAQQADSPRHQAQALSGLGDAEYAAGHMLSAYDYFTQCLALCDQFGLARIEAANRFMLGTVQIYLNELDDALRDSLDSASAAHQVGHVRAEIVSRLTASWILLDQEKLDSAMQQVQQALELTEKLGAKRFEPFLNESKARILIAQNQKPKALLVAEQAMQITRAMGLKFIGPWILGTIALATSHSKQRDSALAEGATLLQQGCVGHNYYQFYRAAIEVSLLSANWDTAEHYANVLEAYTYQEPNPWAIFHIQWGRTLAIAGKMPHSQGLINELNILKEQAQQIGFHARVNLIDQALNKY